MSCPDKPLPPQNRPGLSSLVYRIGDYATFKQRLLERLTCLVPGSEPLQTVSLANLTTRSTDDTLIALLDAVAVVGDVLTFYQERLINEGYLRTAIERRSVLELAREIGYELSPGVAASTVLAFTLENTPNAPKQVTIPKGTQVLSIPGKNELPQTFETEAELLARVDWNSLQPRLTRPQVVTPETRQIYLEGTATQLQAGDRVLLFDEKDADQPTYLLTLSAVEAINAAGHTVIHWNESIPAILDPVPRYPKILAFRQKAALFGSNAAVWNDLSAEVKRANGGTLKGGVFEWQNSTPPTWIPRNTGLPNADVLCLASHGDFLFAGTPTGVFRSSDRGVTWEQVNTGLTTTSVQALYSDYETGRMLAGTSGGGLFRSSDNGETWVAIHTGKIISEKLSGDKFIARNFSLPDTIVRAIAFSKTQRVTGAGTISTSNLAVNGSGTLFTQQLRIGSRITVLEQKSGTETIVPHQTFSVQSIANDLSLTVVPQNGKGFIRYQLPLGTSFSATNRADGEPDITITGGSISSQGRTVTGSGTQFSELQRGGQSTITAAGQTRTIERIDSNESLIINEPFITEALSSDTAYSIETWNYLAGTDEGLFFAFIDALPLEREWTVVELLQGQVIYDLIPGKKDEAGNIALFAGSSIGVYRCLTALEQWELLNLSQPTFCLATYDDFLFAGTEDGVYRSPLDGSAWVLQSNGLPSNTRVLALAVVEEGETTHLLAGTEIGLYYSTDDGETWTSANTAATSQEIPALTTMGTTMFAGSRFAGFVEQEFPGFEVPTQPIDLDTLYPKILPDSTLVLLDNSYFEQFQVKEVSTEPKSQFLLTSKVTRVLADRAIATPELFDRRRTIVLAQSEPLTLAPEKLTVELQQDQIFQDPILGDRLYLQEFIQGLQRDKTLIVSGQFVQAEVQTVGGMFRSVKWRPSHQGLTSLEVRSVLAESIPTPADPTTTLIFLWAATDSGVFQSQDEGVTWEAVNQGLTNKDVRSLVLARQGTQNKLFAATGTAIFRAEVTVVSPNDITWIAVNQGLLSQDIHAIVSSSSAQQLWVATGDGVFQSSDFGDTWTAFNSGLGNLDVRCLQLSSTVLYAGTAGGVFRLQTDQPDQPWESLNIGLADLGIQALAIASNTLSVGTGSGVFRRDDSTSSWTAINSGLTNLNIQAIALKPSNTLFVATEKGVFRSFNNGAQWEIANQGLAGVLVHSFQGLPNGDLLAATASGIYRFETAINPVIWEQGNTGLTNAQILAIAQGENQMLLVGTREGIFRSLDRGETWEPKHEGLVNKVVQALVYQAPWFVAGTADGIYRSENGGNTWQAANTGLAHRDVRVIVPLLDSSTTLLAGTVNGGIFRSDDQGQTWMATRLTNTDVQAIALSQRLTPAQPNFIFAGTVRDGIFRSENGGNSWQAIPDTRTGTGTVASKGMELQGKGTQFLTELRAGDTIDVMGQPRQVVEIKDDFTLLMDAPFRPDLLPNQEFRINTGLTNRNITALGIRNQLGVGTITSRTDAVTGKFIVTGTEPLATLFQVGDAITAGDDTRIVTGTVPGDAHSVTINQPFAPPLGELTRYALMYIFAGTAGSGVFRSSNYGDRWEPVNTNLSDLEIRCLTVSAEGEIWIGTANGGVFRSINNGDVWEPVNTHLTNTDVRAIYFAKSGSDVQIPFEIIGSWLRWFSILQTDVDLRQLIAWFYSLIGYLIALSTEKTLLVGGIGILRSPEEFSTVEVQAGDRLQVLTAPEPLSPSPDHNQRWQLRDRNGFVGILETVSPATLKFLPADPDGDFVSETVQIKTPPQDQQLPILELQAPLTYRYDPATVKVYANIVSASHGETVQEVLGSGEGTIANQRFALQKPPLTFVSASTATGAASTLQLRVDRVLWNQVPALYPLSDRDQGYIVRIQDDGSTEIMFGDGIKGSRLPTGIENITAVYRSGLGVAGNVRARSLSLLKTRPLGVQSVLNPLAATGGADRDSLETARVKTPRTVRTLDRIVSLRDFEDFARMFAGIGKAQAIALWNGDEEMVQVTIAGINGADIPVESALYVNLLAAIDQVRDPVQQVHVDSYERVLFDLDARLLLDARYDAKTVEGEVRSYLGQTFAFDQRQFGQGVTASEAIAAIQQVKGVIAVDLDALYRLGSSKALENQLTALPGRWNFSESRAEPAQLLLLNPSGIKLTLTSVL